MKNIRYIIAVFIVYVAQFALAEVQVLSDNEVKDEILYRASHIKGLIAIPRQMQECQRFVLAQTF